MNASTLEELLIFGRAWPKRRWRSKELLVSAWASPSGRWPTAGTSSTLPPFGRAARLPSAGHGRQADAHDGAAVALVAQHHARLRHVRPEDPSSVIRLVSDHQDAMVHEHTAGLHRLLRSLVTGRAPTGTSSREAAVLLGMVRARHIRLVVGGCSGDDSGPARTRRRADG